MGRVPTFSMLTETKPMTYYQHVTLNLQPSYNNYREPDDYPPLVHALGGASLTS
jgi:hypothetical protein